MPNPILTVLLGPFLLLQGWRVRQSIPRLPEPPGEREGASGPEPRLRLLILGDSSAAGVGAESQDEALLGVLLSRVSEWSGVAWHLHARTGAKTANVLRSIDRIDRQPFDVVVSVFGVNDVTSGIGINDWLDQQRQLFTIIRDRFEDPLIVVSGLPPVKSFPALPQPLRWFLGSKADTFSAALRNACAEEGCTFVPIEFEADESMMATDGFHPGPGIYRLWASAMGQEIRKNVAIRKNVEVQEQASPRPGSSDGDNAA